MRSYNPIRGIQNLYTFIKESPYTRKIGIGVCSALTLMLMTTGCDWFTKGNSDIFIISEGEETKVTPLEVKLEQIPLKVSIERKPTKRVFDASLSGGYLKDKRIALFESSNYVIVSLWPPEKIHFSDKIEHRLEADLEGLNYVLLGSSNPQELTATAISMGRSEVFPLNLERSVIDVKADRFERKIPGVGLSRGRFRTDYVFLDAGDYVVAVENPHENFSLRDDGSVVVAKEVVELMDLTREGTTRGRLRVFLENPGKSKEPKVKESPEAGDEE